MGYHMLEAVEEKISGRALIGAGDRVLVALSGGADSVALLHLLRQLAPRLSFSLFAAHLDHGIRPESREEALFASRLCRALEVPLTTERVEVPALAEERRIGIEDAARGARREFLRRTAESLDCAAIALGHHRGDQAETLLHRLLRGSGASGLASMRYKSGAFIRPLLDCTKGQILTYLSENRLGHVEDESNADLSYTRNSIRHSLLPRLASYNPRIEDHLVRLSARLALEEDYWRQEEERSLDALGRKAEGGLDLDRDALLLLHPALRSRVLRRALDRLRGDLGGIASSHIEAIESILTGRRPQGELHLPGGWVARRYGRLLLRLEAPCPPPTFEILVEGPGAYSTPDGTLLRVEILDAPLGGSETAVEFDAALVPFPLTLRPFRPGDRFRPSGAGEGKKLKKFFIDAKIERERRASLPLVVQGGVLWAVGIGRCRGLHPAPGGEPVLRITLCAFP